MGPVGAVGREAEEEVDEPRAPSLTQRSGGPQSPRPAGAARSGPSPSACSRALSSSAPFLPRSASARLSPSLGGRRGAGDPYTQASAGCDGYRAPTRRGSTGPVTHARTHRRVRSWRGRDSEGERGVPAPRTSGGR